MNKKRLSIEVLKTHGLNTKIKKTVNFKKFTSIDNGIKNLVIWAKKILIKSNFMNDKKRLFFIGRHV